VRRARGRTRPRFRQCASGILSRSFLLDVLLYGALITASTLAAFGWALARPGGHPTTVAFMTLALAQVFHLGNARSRGPVLRASAALSNPYAVGALILSLVLQIAPMYVDPLARVLRVVPLTAPEWLIVMVCSSVTAVAGQALRLVGARSGRRP
jgi:P-type Ca2+ transporter type 2C